MSRSRVIATAFVLVGWAVWGLLSVTMLTLAKADGLFIATYVLYLLFGAVLLGVCRRDLLSPPGLFTLTGLFAFGLSIPLIYGGDRYIETSDYTSFVVTDESLFKVLIIVLVAQASFVLGYYLNLFRHAPIRALIATSPKTRKVTLITYLLLAGIVIVAVGIRAKLHLGEAGVQPNFPYAGYFQYTLFDGTLLLCAWFLAQSLRQSRMYVLLGLSLLVMMAIAQALLGWRGGIAQVGWITIGLFWYQSPSKAQRTYSLAWLLILPLVAGSIIQLGNAVRSERLGGAKEFAASTSEMIQKIAYRSQGTTRLALVANKMGSLTLFNNFLIRDIYAEGLTTTTYVDRKYYAVAARQSNSFGTSGPGGPYVAMGLFGVVLAYLSLGAFYRCIYSRVVDLDDKTGNILATILYSYLIFLLSSLLSENFNIAFLKNMIAVFAFLFVLKIVIDKSKVKVGGNRLNEETARSSSMVPRARIER